MCESSSRDLQIVSPNCLSTAAEIRGKPRMDPCEAKIEGKDRHCFQNRLNVGLSPDSSLWTIRSMDAS